MKQNPKFYITTAIHYASGNPHIGHAYENIITDLIARYKRLIGFDVYFLTGLDEHGEKIAQKAQENNLNSKAWVDLIYQKFIDLWKMADISNDGFIRTTDKGHCEAVKKAFSDFYKSKYIYLGQWNSLYCVGCEETYTDAEAIKKPDGLYCKTGHKLITKSEPSYFFTMSKFNEWIKELLTKNKDFIFPANRANELLGTFINDGITDLSVTRTKQSCPWAIDINEDPQHTIYVWIDALLNYITALGYNQDKPDLFKKFWADEQSEVLHVVGKDITRFHAIYWPIMLKCLNLRMPSHILSHGFIMAEDGRKMSKSFNNVIDPVEIIKEYGSDIVRYYLAKEFIIANDNHFSKKKLVELFNSDLANIYGNLVSRFLGMINKYTNGVIVKPDLTKLSANTTHTVAAMESLLDKCPQFINSYNLSGLLANILEIGKIANTYVELTKPWELQKNNQDNEIHVFLFYLANIVRVLTILISPVLTNGSQTIIKQMRFTPEQLSFENIKKYEILFGHQVVKEFAPIYVRYNI